MVGIIDFNAGNITSLERALDYLKIPYIRSKTPSELADFKFNQPCQRRS